jgi:cysteine desulfurase
MIYLDHNATTPVDPEVSDAVASSLKRDFGNPSSSHLAGRKAKEVVENAREAIANFLGCSHEEICFTSGGTESNNFAILGLALHNKKGHIVTSAIEHPSVLNPCRHLESLGFEVTYVPVDGDGVVRLDDLGHSVKANTFLISIMHSNNETGVLQPVEEIGDIAKKHGITFHVDAAQSVGKMPFTLADSAIDLLTVVSHKFYGPKGIGALYIRKGIALKPLLFGAGHEMGLRPGTENVPGIVGLAKACQIAKRDIRLRVSHAVQLRDMLFNDLSSALPDILLNGHKTKRLPNTLNIRIPGVPANELVEMIKDQVAASTGSACHAGRQTPSAVLKGMGLSDEEALTSLRLSVGADNTEEELKKAVEIIVRAVTELRKKPPAPPVTAQACSDTTKTD